MEMQLPDRALQCSLKTGKAFTQTVNSLPLLLLKNFGQKNSLLPLE